MPKPAHSHAQSSLQSVWDVGRYLSRYPVAGVAFEAPGTCKQLTPQITVVCGGARETTLLYLNTHAACANAPESYLVHNAVVMRAQNRYPVSVHCIEGAPVHQSTSQYHKAARGQLTRQCYRTRAVNLVGAALPLSTSAAQTVSGLHKQKLFPSESKRTKRCMRRWRRNVVQEPANKAFAVLWWCSVPVAVISWPQ